MTLLGAWAGGYSWGAVKAAPPEDLEPIAKLGAIVILTTVVSALDWFVASLAYTASLPGIWRLAVAALCGTLGAAIVLVIDRGALYAMDTRGTGHGIKFYLAVRLALVLVVSTFTAEVTAPMVLKDELGAFALHQREAADDQRAHKLENRFDVAQKTTAVANDKTRLASLEQQAVTVPAVIKDEQSATAVCWQGYARERAQGLDAGEDESDLQARLRPRAVRCNALNLRASKDLSQYRMRVNRDLDETYADRKTAVAALADATREVKTRQEDGRKIEQETIVATSASVLAALVRSDAGAAFKYLSFVLLVLILETLPLTSKMMSGRSALGARIGAAREKAVLSEETDLQIHTNECRLARETSSTMTMALAAALQSEMVNAEMQQIALGQVQATAPMEAAKHTLRNIEREHRSAEEMKRRWPGLTPVIAEIWAKAIRDAADNLSRF